MTSRFADTRLAVGQVGRRGVVVALAAIAFAAVVMLAALGIAERSNSDTRREAQALAGNIEAARTIFDRDRWLLNRLADAAALGLSGGSALPDLPRDLHAVGLFDAAGSPLATASRGLDDRTIAAIGAAVANAIAFHPGISPVAVSRIGDGDAAIAAMAQPWNSADGFSSGIAIVAFSQTDLATLGGLARDGFDIVTADGAPLFAGMVDPVDNGVQFAAIPGTSLLLRYRPQADHAARMLRTDAPFALLVVVALAAALGPAIVLIRRDRAVRREIARRDALERKLRGKIAATAAVADRTDEINRAKSRFYAQVTHELRTPLNAILGFSETIRQEMFGPVTNPRYLEYAGLIHDAGSHLLALINDLLDNARIEAGKMEIVPIRVSAAAVARSALDLVELLAAERNVRLEAVGLGTCSDLNADPRALKQVLVNLLSNAIKYTPTGGRIELRFSARPDGGVAIDVADTGAGMSAEDVLYAFEPFGRAGADQLRRQPGTGLGLSLARALVRLHGGDLTLASRLNAGTTATVTLPASAAFGATSTALAPMKSKPDSTSARAA
jgi:signal transduction histidine kinase